MKRVTKRLLGGHYRLRPDVTLNLRFANIKSKAATKPIAIVARGLTLMELNTDRIIGLIVLGDKVAESLFNWQYLKPGIIKGKMGYFSFRANLSVLQSLLFADSLIVLDIPGIQIEVLEHRQDWSSLVPRHIGALVNDIVSRESGHGDEVYVRYIQASSKCGEIFSNSLVNVLGEVEVLNGRMDGEEVYFDAKGLVTERTIWSNGREIR